MTGRAWRRFTHQNSLLLKCLKSVGKRSLPHEMDLQGGTGKGSKWSMGRGFWLLTKKGFWIVKVPESVARRVWRFNAHHKNVLLLSCVAARNLPHKVGLARLELAGTEESSKLSMGGIWAGIHLLVEVDQGIRDMYALILDLDSLRMQEVNTRLCELVRMPCSLQTPRLPATGPPYPLTCSNSSVGLALFTFQNLKR